MSRQSLGNFQTAIQCTNWTQKNVPISIEAVLIGLLSESNEMVISLHRMCPPTAEYEMDFMHIHQYLLEVKSNVTRYLQ